MTSKAYKWLTSDLQEIQREGTEPLLELTHVLNMVAPRPSQKLQTLQAPSVAAELLVSSALRMHWPADKRRLAPKEQCSEERTAKTSNFQSSQAPSIPMYL